MQSNYVRAASTTGWVLAVVTLGYFSGATSVAGWTVVAALSLVPPAVMTRLWSAPAPTMSESIRNALR